eukprot:m.671738 g.671738  ORF g.671738 m.671738 type:complete len:210 (+) comp22776_c1_seq5:1664-2293(+)
MQSPNCSLFKISYSVRSTKLYIIATPQSLQCTLVLILTQSLSQPCMFAHRCTALQCTTATWLLSAHYDKTLNVRDPRVDIKKTALSIATEHNATITHMACSPNGDVVATLARDHSMRLHDVRTLTHMRTLCADGFNVGTAGCQPCFSSDGHYLAAGSMDGRVFIWNSNTGALEKILRDGHTAAVMAMAWHPNGAGLLSVGKDHKLALWG